MKARAPRILMPGTAPDGRGGVAALVAVLRAGLFETAGVRYANTHRDGGLLTKLGAAASGLRQAVGACLWRRLAIVQAHAASHASAARKSLLLWLARCAGCQTIFHLHGGGFRQFATVRSSALTPRWIRHMLERSSLFIALTEGWAGFVRGFAPRTRVTGLFEAVALPAPRFPMPHLVLAGSGELAQWRRAALELGIGDRFELTGWLDGGAQEEQLARAAVFCLPSHAEGLPIARLEAMAAGKAVVATAVEGIPEAVSDDEHGLLVPPHDGVALASALARMLEDAGMQKRLDERARARVAQHYSTQAVCGRLAAIYNELAGAR